MWKAGELGMKVYRKLIRPVHCYPGQGYEPKTELVEKEEKWYPEEEREHLEEKYGYLNEGHFSDLIFEEKYEPYLLKEKDNCENCAVAIEDRQPIVRCKYCNHSTEWYGDKRRCFLWNENGIDVFEDGYCSYGNPKQEGQRSGNERDHHRST